MTLAARNGSTNIITFLIRNGADINAQDRNGLTPLVASIDGQKQKLLPYFLKMVWISPKWMHMEGHLLALQLENKVLT